jgi:phospholipid-binding lipoprotein MlaA
MRCRRSVALVVCALLGLLSAHARADGEPDDSSPNDAASSIEKYDPLYDEAAGDEHVEPVSDPLEPVNRAIFGFNEQVDHYVLDPITRGYRFVVPAPARRGVERFFINLKQPVVFTNLILQGRGRDAAITLGRFAANTTLGVAGIFDYGNDVIGWRRTTADFGQTLAVYGIPSGPYLVVPIFGPSNARDAVGNVADQAMNPLTYFFAPLQLQWSLIFGGSQGIAYREANADALDALRDASVDFYAALRSAYTQAREGAVQEARAARGEP